MYHFYFKILHNKQCHFCFSWGLMLTSDIGVRVALKQDMLGEKCHASSKPFNLWDTPEMVQWPGFH